MLLCGNSPQRSPAIPATGFRSRETGALSDVGTAHYCRSSSSYAAGAPESGALRFTDSSVAPFRSPGRAWGSSVRCVQHLQGGFLIR